MRTYRHWTPRYLFNRFTLGVHELLHPNEPWLTPAAVTLLNARLKKTDCGLEFGSGRSTIWFAHRLGRMTSVEHDRVWYDKVFSRLQRDGLTNVDYHLCEVDQGEDGADRTEYVRMIDRFADGSLDMVLVDGVYRSACANRVIPKLRTGGLLVVDNINWYLPCESLAPNSRRTWQGAASADWARFGAAVSAWQCAWSSSGVTDTAVFFKP
jgi:predicted O-methyltransferase YrrM